MQPDGRLVEHVEHADQAGPDLSGQPDALRLTAGQRGRRAGQRQILQPDIEQKAQPRLDFLEHLPGDRLLARTQGERVQKIRAVRDGQLADLGDRLRTALPRGQRAPPGSPA